MEIERFRQSPAGRLVTVGVGTAAYAAFVPHPLPPPLELDAGLVRLLSEADRALGELAGLGRFLPNPYLLISPLVHQEAVLSSRIEGTRTTLAELYAYEAAGQALPGGDAGQSEDAREVSNYVRALEYGVERLTSLPLSKRFIRELHERLMSGVRGDQATPGRFRTSQNWIGAPGSTLATATYVPPPVQDGQLESCLDALEAYLNADDLLPPLVRLGLIHAQFEAIHPFLDGNGRIGRLLLALILIDWQLLPQPSLYLSAFFERNRLEYYDRLLAVSERGDWRGWTAFFLQGVAEQARDAAERLRRLQELRSEWQRWAAGDRAAASLLRLIDELFTTPLLSVRRAERVLGVSYRSARLNVLKLVAAGILEPSNDARYARTFRARRVLEIVAT